MENMEESREYPEFCSQGVAGPLQGSGVQAFLVLLEPVPILRSFDGVVNEPQDVPALIPSPAQLLLLWGARWDNGKSGNIHGKIRGKIQGKMGD